MAKYQQYAEYKESGVEWLEQVPSEWSVVKLSYKMKLASGETLTSNEIEPIGKYAVYGGNGLRGYTKNYNCDGSYILIGRQGALCGNINLAKGKFFATEHAVVVYPYEEFNITFLSGFLEFMDLGQYSVSAAQPGLSVDRINALKILVPPITEQIIIGEFLDHETAQIDTLIEKQQTLIKLLKEKRQAVISHAVTKGLNPDVPMKDSGVEWLGEVPAHWVVMQFRRITSLSQGLQIPQSERFHEPSKNNVEYITIKSIHAGNTLEHREYINKPSLRVQCDYDDVLLARTGATGEVITGVKGAFHNNFFKIDYSEKITKNFLVNMLKVQELKSHLLMLAGTTTIPDLNHGAFLSTAIALPSLDEQEEICLEISRLSEKYNLLLEVALKQVKLLQERRTALISAAVTGKIDVRGWVAPE